VRNLSQRSAGAARETRTMVEGTLASVRKGVDSAAGMTGTFGQVEEAVAQIVQLADDMGKTLNGNGNGGGHF
ncbi:MAG: hypothetical protein LIQ31_03455, partial [Planctomycetes bacterium]|nr:hypothetical protein [Planctomycetota bacterium]